MSAAQKLPTHDLPVGPGGINISGQRFGLLTALRIIEKDTGGNRWLLRCDCGRYAIRTVGALRQALRENVEQQCSDCSRELRSGMTAARREERGEGWARMLELTGELYSEHMDAAHCTQMTEAIAAFLGFSPDPEAPRFPLSVSASEDRAHSNGGQRAAFLLPRTGRCWRCSACHQLFSQGFGCTVCLGMICLPCVRLELHFCASLRADYERCMNTDRAAELPSGDGLGRRVRIVQPYLPDEVRRRLVGSLVETKVGEAVNERKKQPRAEPLPRNRFIFDWTDWTERKIEGEP